MTRFKLFIFNLSENLKYEAFFSEPKIIGFVKLS